ncbi:MAG: molybdenum cofactor guanylyltransferase [bacterium]|nr:molybdenum cofactor guanylyltransferase [bacterium]
MSFERILGVVLAGGASRRMGFDKASLELDGLTLVERSATVLEAACDEVVISMQPGTAWAGASFRTIHDRRTHCGPLAGLESALEHAAASASSVFLLACDMPHVDARAVRYITDRALEAHESAAVVPSIGGRYQPLCAFYRTATLTVVRRQLDSGLRSMHGLLEAVSLFEVEIPPSLPFSRPDLFRNLNEPADLLDLAGNAKP